MFSLDSLKQVKNIVDRSLSVLLILSVIELLYVNHRLNVNILHTVSTKYFLLFRIIGSYYKPIDIIARPREYDEGNTMTLKCEMFWKGSMITWRKDGEQLLHAGDRRVNISSTVRPHLTQTHLVVERVSTNDSGEYTCGAEDDSGHHFTDSINITIKSKL